jgi:DNA-binding response OmpR family regulator
MAQKEQPNLIILDLGLPDVDGFGVLERLQDSDIVSTIPVIVLTVRDPQFNAEKALLAGATAFDMLRKFFTLRFVIIYR